MIWHKTILCLLTVAVASGCAGSTQPAQPSYEAALARWASIEDINAWIGDNFRYDMERALLLSESRRSRGAQVRIHSPENFYRSPTGMCVDLSRFAYESARRVAPDTSVHYLMIEFEPVEIQGETLRRHWLVSFMRDGKHYAFADSKRPGHIAGPYDSLDDFAADYARFRDREIVAVKQRDSFRKTKRKKRQRQQRARRAIAPQ